MNNKLINLKLSKKTSVEKKAIIDESLLDNKTPRGSMLTKNKKSDLIVNSNPSVSKEVNHEDTLGTNLMFVSAETVDQSGDDSKDFNFKLPFQKIVAIGVLKANSDIIDGVETISIRECSCSGPSSLTEEQLLDGFWTHLEKSKAKIVTFNGRGFIVPVFRYRSMKYKLSASYFSNAGDRYSGYMNRYSLKHHVDLMDVLSDFRSSQLASLKDICTVMEIPFLEKSLENTIEEQRNNAENSIISSYLLYARWKLFVGDMTPESYDVSINNLLTYIKNDIKKDFFVSKLS
jgi:predicted PolB exonuclease-like 3'-5' exonuclease